MFSFLGANFTVRAVFFVGRACSATSGWKSRPNLMELKGSEGQGGHREVGSEGSVEQRYGPMDKNWIGGLRRRTSGQLIAKPLWRTTPRTSGPQGLNSLNRRMRTRLYVGVRGASRRRLPLSRLNLHRHPQLRWQQSCSSSQFRCGATTPSVRCQTEFVAQLSGRQRHKRSFLTGWPNHLPLAHSGSYRVQPYSPTISGILSNAAVTILRSATIKSSSNHVNCLLMWGRLCAASQDCALAALRDGHTLLSAIL